MGIAPHRDEVELTNLGGHRVAQLTASVTRIDAEERRKAVQISVAVVVPDVAPLAADDDRHLVLGAERPHPREMHPQMALSLILESACLGLSRSRGAGRCCHPSPPVSLASSYNATRGRPTPQAELC